MTSAVDKQGAEASPKFWVLLTASLVSCLIMFDLNIVAVSCLRFGDGSDRPLLTSSG
jgi:hypothetical protein